MDREDRGLRSPDHYFIASGFDWAPGQLIDVPTFATSPQKTFFAATVPEAYSDTPDYLARRETERTFEAVRADRYSTAPSRRQAIFLSTDLAQARFWNLTSSRRSYHIYEVSVADRIASSVANYLWFNYAVRVCRDPQRSAQLFSSMDWRAEVAGAAYGYWGNLPVPAVDDQAREEVLYLGSLEVVRKCSSDGR